MKIKWLKLKLSLNKYRNLHGISLCFFSLIFLLSTSAQAATTVSDVRGWVSFTEELKSWKYHQDVFGLPHVFTLNTKEQKKSSLSITFTGQAIKLDAKELNKTLKNYQDSRSAWAKKKGITVNGFEKYQYLLKKPGIKIHQVGWNYSTAYQKDITEQSIYIECPDNSLMHLKAVILPEHKKEIKKIHSFIQSISSCKRIQN